MNEGEVMGWFSKKPWQPPQGVTIDQAGVPLGIPAGTILREAENAGYLWCDKVASDQLNPQLFYPVQLVNKGNSVTAVSYTHLTLPTKRIV